MNSKLEEVTKRTFDEAVKMLKERGSCLIIRPTGFGKSYIMANIFGNAVMSRFILPSSMACMKALRLSSQKVGLSFALRSAASFP